MQRAAVLAAAPLLRAPRARVLAPARQMSGGAYDGFHIHRPAALNSRVAKVVATTMWTWMMYRGYHDLGHMLGMHLPWDAPGHEGHVDPNDEDDLFLERLKATTE